MFKSKFASNLCVLLRSVNLQNKIKLDINSITDFQNMPEYINNKELGIFFFENSDVFINWGESPFNV